MYFPYIKHTTQFLTINNKLFLQKSSPFHEYYKNVCSILFIIFTAKKKKKISETKNKKHESPITMIPSTIMRHCINPF